MFYLLVLIHIVVAVILTIVVLLQSGKAGDLASAFGGASTQTAFGTRGAATLLTKVTTICAIIFMLTSLWLSILYTRDYGTSVTEGIYPDAPLSGTTGETETPEATPPPAQQPGEEGSSEPPSN